VEITTKQRKISEKSLANLKPFKPGQSGNPKGRAKKSETITSILKDVLFSKDGSSKTPAELIAESMVELAKHNDKRGYVPIVKEILDRTEGKVKGEIKPYEDNRTYNILVADDKTKDEIQRLISGRPHFIEGEKV